MFASVTNGNLATYACLSAGTRTKRRRLIRRTVPTGFKTMSSSTISTTVALNSQSIPSCGYRTAHDSPGSTSTLISVRTIRRGKATSFLTTVTSKSDGVFCLTTVSLSATAIGCSTEEAVGIWSIGMGNPSFWRSVKRNTHPPQRLPADAFVNVPPVERASIPPRPLLKVSSEVITVVGSFRRACLAILARSDLSSSHRPFTSATSSKAAHASCIWACLRTHRIAPTPAATSSTPNTSRTQRPAPPKLGKARRAPAQRSSGDAAIQSNSTRSATCKHPCIR